MGEFNIARCSLLKIEIRRGVRSKKNNNQNCSMRWQRRQPFQLTLIYTLIISLYTGACYWCLCGGGGKGPHFAQDSETYKYYISIPPVYLLSFREPIKPSVINDINKREG